jgi:hypothetical protein
LVVDTQNTMYKFMSHHYYKDTQEIIWKYGRTQISGEKTATDQKCIKEEVERRYNSESATTIPFRKFSFRPLSGNTKIKVYEIMLPIVLYGYEIRCLITH